MGFKDFAYINSTMLDKQAWRALKNPNALWARILKTIYHPYDCLTWAKRKGGDSLVWRSILHGTNVLMKSRSWLIGKGTNVDIMEDNWLPGGEKVDVIRDVGVTRVSDILDSENFCWDLRKIRRCSPHLLLVKSFKSLLDGVQVRIFFGGHILRQVCI